MATLQTLCVTLCLTLVIFSVSDALQACPDNCVDKECSELGCVQCKGGYYLFFDQDLGISDCRTTCPDGYYVNPVNWCQACETMNCAKCSDEYRCTECEKGYHVDENGDCLFTSYDI